VAINSLLATFAARIAPLNVNYSYGLRKGDAVYPYWVGEITETTHAFEDGSSRGQIRLRGWTRGELSALMEEAERIKQQFTGYTVGVEGFGCAIDYNSLLPVPQADIELKSVEIQFDYKTWEG